MNSTVQLCAEWEALQLRIQPLWPNPQSFMFWWYKACMKLAWGPKECFHESIIRILSCLCDNLSVSWSHCCQCTPQCFGLQTEEVTLSDQTQRHKCKKRNFSQLNFCCIPLLYLFCSLLSDSSPSMLWTANLGCNINFFSLSSVLVFIFLLLFFSSQGELSSTSFMLIGSGRAVPPRPLCPGKSLRSFMAVSISI